MTPAIFNLGLAQSSFPPDGDVVRQVRAFAKRAHDQEVDLLAFPENLMCPREMSASEIRSIAEPIEGPFVRALQDIASSCDMWVVFTMFQQNPHGLPFNTAVVVDDAGSIRATYDKCHLYDAHNVSESDRTSAGSELCPPVHTPFCTLGVGICYDLRFPEVARVHACNGCNLLLYSAAWHDGPHKLLHWRTLLRARAIENECYVAGVCHAHERYIGQSFVYDPMGNELSGGSSDLVVCSLDLAQVEAARDAMPILGHRRPELYGAVVEKMEDA